MNLLHTESLLLLLLLLVQLITMLTSPWCCWWSRPVSNYAHHWWRHRTALRSIFSAGDQVNLDIFLLRKATFVNGWEYTRVWQYAVRHMFKLPTAKTDVLLFPWCRHRQQLLFRPSCSQASHSWSYSHFAVVCSNSDKMKAEPATLFFRDFFLHSVTAVSTFKATERI